MHIAYLSEMVTCDGLYTTLPTDKHAWIESISRKNTNLSESGIWLRRETSTKRSVKLIDTQRTASAVA